MLLVDIDYIECWQRTLAKGGGEDLHTLITDVVGFEPKLVSSFAHRGESGLGRTVVLRASRAIEGGRSAHRRLEELKRSISPRAPHVTQPPAPTA